MNNIHYTFTPIDTDGNHFESIDVILADGEAFEVELPGGYWLGITAKIVARDMTLMEYAALCARCEVERDNHET